MKKMSSVLIASMILGLFVFSFSRAQNLLPQNASTCSEIIIALTTNNTLLSFSSDAPGTPFNSTAITGLLAGESLLGIDYRPALGEIFGLSDANRLYIIDSRTGVARFTAQLSVNLIGAAFGVDFNPVPDRLRVVSEANQNLRINVETGATTVDGMIGYASADRNSTADANIVAVAYINNFAGATATTLYGIDSTLDALVIQNPPNDGILTTVGSLGVDTNDLVGFDIAAGSTRAFASLTPSGGNLSNLYTINLTTGAATLVGGIGSGQTIRDITVSPRRPLTIFALTSGNNLLTFSSTAPGVITSQTRLRGLQRGESLLAIDFRPVNKRLYALGSTGTIYTINLNKGNVTPRPIAPFSAALNATAVGFDFNPVPDRIRLVTDADQNLRLNPDTGDVAAVDGTLAFVSGDPNSAQNPNVVGSAYTNNFAGTTTTTLYGIDSNLDVLVIQNPPNDGRLTTVGPLGVNATDVVGFDIYGCDLVGFAALALPGDTASGLYRINLATGAATRIGSIGGGELIQGIAIQFP